ncbi:MAG TPA: extracellular solute-binding protein [Chloroflexota bacterium]
MRRQQLSLGWALVVALALAAGACGRPTAPTGAPGPGAAPASAPAPRAAGASAAASAAAQTDAATSPEWEAIVAAAKQEGVLVLSTHTGASTFQRLHQRIREQFPWLDVQATAMKASDFTPRVLAEQKNGQYLWDVHVGPTANMLSVLTPARAFEPMRPFLEALPADVKDDGEWAGGFELFADPDRPYTFLDRFTVTGGFHVNRSLASRDEVATWDDLLNPKWKDKILVYDPARANAGSIIMAALLGTKGEDYVRRLMDQVKVIETRSQATEWVAQGRFPIGIGLDDDIMEELQAKGIGKSVELVGRDEAAPLLAWGADVLKNAPHPNAAKVFLRWYLSQAGQDVVASTLQQNSRRLDVKSYDPANTPDYQQLDRYQVRVGTTMGEALLLRALAIAKEK